VAEDNPVNRLVLVRLLEKLGYQTDEATNGLEAVEACAESPYAAVLMDVQMPTMGGFEATDHIRQQNVTRGMHTPIIAVTAHTLPSDREQCLAAGMDDYLPKPVNPEALQAALTRWLGQPVGAVERVQ
jgi:CheY-like chemotaxis protein